MNYFFGGDGLIRHQFLDCDLNQTCQAQADESQYMLERARATCHGHQRPTPIRRWPIKFGAGEKCKSQI